MKERKVMFDSAEWNGKAPSRVQKKIDVHVIWRTHCLLYASRIT